MGDRVEIREEGLSEAGRLLVRKAGLARKALGDVLREEMKIRVRAAMIALPPFRSLGDRSFAGQLSVGKRAVADDVSQVYGTVSEAYAAIRDNAGEQGAGAAKGFRSALGRGDRAEAERILRRLGGRLRNVEHVGGPLRKSLHRQARDRRGRVRRQRPLQLVGSRREINDYVREVQAEVGSLKEGFGPAADALGSRRPAWISRHRTRGRFQDRADKALNPFLKADNLVRYSGTFEQLIRRALDRRLTRLRREVESRLGRVLRPFTERVTA